MAIGSAYARDLARRSPPPDELDAMEPDADEKGGPPDEDADDAALQSAYADFARAAGIKQSPATLSALQEIIRLTMK